MPEGDSVLQLSQRLQFLVGKTVTHTSLRTPRYATHDFSGARCTKIWPYGKYLFMLFEEHILATHLKMEGSWAMHLVGDKWRKPGYTARVVLRFAHQPRDIEIVGHQLGLVRVLPVADYQRFIADLGPDILSDDWEDSDVDSDVGEQYNEGREARETGSAEALRRIMQQPHRPIGTALLDQTNLVGIGNEYRAEICFLAGVHPASRVGKLSYERVAEILEIARRIMWANRHEPVRVTTGIKRAGETTYVFGRNNRPCRRCRSLIVSDSLGGPDQKQHGGITGELERIIWWCPQCQPLLD
ncbi:DNA-formamidopyrimidine glycosylase family protein [Corynebacterium pseudodiphtheriticum]|uniref:DNA-formamidopyrimidine glycosylase family protein n=1 Tax=Corynebacterium pseudodiphtheriticum TaxID=37637 RepID=UPI001EF72A44|nr:DNA-formamidopyrimidine glycosylase family protein [Corynebacterium pseudodiphtheriticum]MCG7252501.1 Fpg/Nei family DNA glycosylase [Corynebacterium pseudodiphtheriticum]MDK4205724.1 DNA-formamidopyrimidine glycosylase family protein [Corynebacterium pseudodiphtheriticum]MDK4235999.1 DNA-formamidopyrimidine glycosylase family protein [Corynebacterium pseudodiphtheriticum]